MNNNDDDNDQSTAFIGGLVIGLVFGIALATTFSVFAVTW